MKYFLFFCIALICGTAHAQTALTDIDQALKVAQAKQLPLFIDFSAVWCHSCHVMDDQVLNGAEWDSRQDRFVLVRSDADSANGGAWMTKLNVPALPAYLVLNPDGSERGRLTGEMKRANFYPAFDRLLSGEDSLAKLKAEAAAGSVEAVVKVLRAHDERKEQRQGLDWYAKLPEATRKAVQADGSATTRIAIVETHADERELRASRPGAAYATLKLSTAQRAQLAKDCRAHALQALGGPIGTGDHFDVAKVLLFCAEDLPPPQRKAIASAQLPALKALYDKVVPVSGSGMLRDATYALALYYKALDDGAAEKQTYARATAIGRKALDDGHGGLDVKRDHSMADVSSEFLRNEGPEAEYTEMAKAMVEAWPDDFLCQYRYGIDLLKHGKAAEALPYLERASNGASDAWKLGTTYMRAKALVTLQRRAEGEKLFNEALRKAEAQFPERTRIDKEYMKL